MKKQLLWLLLPLCLLLGSCESAGETQSPAETATEAETSAEAEMPTETAGPAETELSPEDRRAAALDKMWRENFVFHHLSGFLELYRLEHPLADAHLDVWSRGEGILELGGYGVDFGDFAAGLPFLEEFRLLWDKDALDARTSEPISREPESVHTENGMNVAMDRAVYPLWPEYISYTMTNETGDSLSYGDAPWIAKWVDGEWVRVQSSGNSFLMLYYVSPGETKPMRQRLEGFSPLGEGLYRYYIDGEKYWAEFAVSAEAEPLDLTDYVYSGAADAAFMRLGASWEQVEALSRVHWPALAYEWRFGSPRGPSDAELVGAFLGEDAVYDEEAELFRAGDKTLDLRDGVRLQTDSALGLALRLLLEGDGAARFLENDKVRTSIEDSSEAHPFARLFGAGWCYRLSPAPEELNAALQDALERDGGTLSAEERAALADFAFTEETSPVFYFYVYGTGISETDDMGNLGFRMELCPIAGVPALAWYVSCGGELIELCAPLRSYSLSRDQWIGESRNPYEAAEALWSGLDEEQRAEKLLSFTYQLVPGDMAPAIPVYVPAWVLETEAADGTLHHFAVNARGLRFLGELDERQAVKEAHTLIRGIWESYRAENPEADVYPVSWTGYREGAHWVLRVDCDGVDIPALEASGLLPDCVRLSYDHEKFNQKQAHPIPREPESTRYYDGGSTVIAMEQADWPLYPDELRFTVKSGHAIQYNPWVEKWADGDWHNVRSAISGTLEMHWIEEEENSFPLEYYAKLGPGLYRLNINSRYWVEFTVSA